MAAPSMTYNSQGNIANAVSLAASTSNGYTGDANAYTVDASAKWEVQITVEYTTGGSVAATSGLKVGIFTGSDSTPHYETIQDTAIPTVAYQFFTPTASHTYRKTFFLPTGKYMIRVTNLDATNSVTFSITTVTIDSIA